MKHIQKDCKAKRYIPQKSANQNVVIVGDREMMKIIQSHQP